MAAEPVDLLLVNGRVLTVDKAFDIRPDVAVKVGGTVAMGGTDLAARTRPSGPSV